MSPFLQELSRRAWRYFDETTHPVTGLVADRARASGGEPSPIASIAATGFGLTALALAGPRGWLAPADAARRVRTTLRFLLEGVEHHHGFFYHFLRCDDGTRVWNCEVSTIDTALLVAGVITARVAFPDDPELQRLAARLCDRIEWAALVDAEGRLHHGWTPEHGLLSSRWDYYSEHPILYLLALGSSRQPLPVRSWRAWRREPWVHFAGRTFLHHPPLFVHQFSHAWFDFRGLRDGGIDYWQNSVDATLAQRDWCAGLADEFPHWGKSAWGVSASDSAHGYVDWGGPPLLASERRDPRIDGTLVPSAVAGSLCFAPAECAEALVHFHDRHGPRIHGRYGFVDAFNPHNGWRARDCIGIAQGITLLMLENLRDGGVWRLFMASPEAKTGLARAGMIRADERASE
ncbi:MAG: glucoamylase family protein [Opitutaceae bacterium]